MRADSDRAEILRFWHTVEMFSPPSVDRVSREKRVFEVREGEPLPWDPRHELRGIRLSRHQAWRHVVYVGVFSLESVFEVLAGVFPADPDSFDERPNGESALAAFVVSDEGRALIGSEVLSCCAWATGRALNPGPGTRAWLSGFDDVRATFAGKFENFFADPDDVPPSRPHRRGRLVEADDLVESRDLAAGLLAAGSELPHVEIRVRSEIVARRLADSVEGHDFLNSFIADDLARVAGQVAAGQAGTALREYLRPDAELDTTARRDVRRDRDVVLAAAAPGAVPLGRWPSRPEHPLALGQQLAVNSAMRMLDGGAGVLGVNGPPGTGKTTMLRDLVAALVVERARRLAELARPGDAFTGQKHRWATGDYTRVVHEWKPELTGFEMVVASANNGAVENVTNEIPALDAIDGCWREDATRLDYFPGVGTALLAVDHDETGRNATGTEAWALVAARLGNKNNRGRFVDTFWYRKPQDPDAELSDEERRMLGLQIVLKGYEQDVPESTWVEAVTDFRHALREVETLRDERVRLHAELLRRPAVEHRFQADDAALRDARARSSAVRGQLADHEKATSAWQQERQRRLDRRLEHRGFRPGLVEWLTTLGRATREWRRRDKELADAVVAADDALTELLDQGGRLDAELEQAERAVVQHEGVVAASRRALTELDRVLDRGRAKFGTCFPDDQWWDDRPRRELAAPWTDPAWNTARSALFLAALRLHKAFLRHAPTQMRQSLQALADILRGDAPRDLSEQAALAAWRTLFFVVPVVSTTFASFARLFSHLGREALGWLLIDEAGQATPQFAAGALWRSRRAIVVGDPLQLEPITTLPFRAEQAIRGDHRVDEQWLTSRTSVQRLADRLTQLGTWLPGADGKIWVGTPLAVHRRCDRPMFGIVNAVAYDGLMIDGTPPRLAEIFRDTYPRLPESKWIDVAATHSQGHWIPDEGRELDRILDFLTSLRFDMSEVMVIAPFRDIARHLAQRRRTYPGLVAGTVHTAQGKQADIVIVMLGSDPTRSGARRWAAAKPNLLNVAVSRAKRRLYVIGNWKSWSTLPHFDILARNLPRTPPR